MVQNKNRKKNFVSDLPDPKIFQKTNGENLLVGEYLSLRWLVVTSLIP